MNTEDENNSGRLSRNSDTSGRTVQGRTIRGILFDKDGTLFDFRNTWLPILLKAAEEAASGDRLLSRDLLKAAGYDPETDRFDADGPIAAGNAEDIAEAWQSVAPRVLSKDEIIAQVDQASRDTGVTGSVPVTNLRRLCARLHGHGLALGLATSDSEEAAHASLAREEIAEFFTVVKGYDSPGEAKPSPEVVQDFCRATGLEVEAVLVVGDTWHDIEMAKAAGAGSVAVLTGAVARSELEPYADVVLESIAELPKYLGIG